MLVIYGQRRYGMVDAYGSECVQTMFLHVYYVPLIPMRSIWMTSTTAGFPIALDGKSVAAAYLRYWAPAVALLALFAAPGIATALIAAAVAALSVIAWRWRALASAARGRSNFNLAAFGTRCEPRRMPARQRERTAAVLKEKWEAMPDRRPPEDVARFGAKSRTEAIIAYGLLRLAAFEHRASDELADRLVSGTYEISEADGPYREAS
jgi:hypothetical protein